MRVGIADIFRGQNEDATRDELWVFPTVDHAGKPIERRIGIGAAHRLDERRDDVVVHISIFVVGQAMLRHGNLDHFACDLVSVLRTLPHRKRARA